MGAYLSQPVTEKVSTSQLGLKVPMARTSPVHMRSIHIIKRGVCSQESDEQENTDFKYGVCAMQGWRTEMVSITAYRVMDAVVSNINKGISKT